MFSIFLKNMETFTIRIIIMINEILIVNLFWSFCSKKKKSIKISWVNFVFVFYYLETSRVRFEHS